MIDMQSHFVFFLPNEDNTFNFKNLN